MRVREWLIFFVLLLGVIIELIGAPLSDYTYDVGGLEFFCPVPGQWHLAGTRCFKFVNTSATFYDAGKICSQQQHNYSQLARSRDWFIYLQLTRRLTAVSNTSEFWTGWHFINNEASDFSNNTINVETISDDAVKVRASIYNPMWAALEPRLWAVPLGARLCVSWRAALNDTGAYGWRIRDCTDRLQVLCETFACRKDLNNATPQYRCSDGSGCVDRRALCNGVRDCSNGEDEHGKVCWLPCAGTASPTVIDSWFGEIRPPGFRADATAGACNYTWIFKVKSRDTLLRLQFLTLNLMSDDSLTVNQDLDGIVSQVTSSGTILAYGPLIRMTFSRKWQGNITNSAGFHVKFYSSSAEECVRRFQADIAEAILTPPRRYDVPDKYIGGVFCEWIIENTNGLISITTEEFGLHEPSDGWLAVLDGEHLVGNFSGSTSLPTVFLLGGAGQHVRIMYTAGISTNGGFRIRFSRYCPESSHRVPCASGSCHDDSPNRIGVNITETPSMSCSLPVIEHGYPLDFDRAAGRLVYSCDYGYRPFNATLANCVPKSGRWLPEPRCTEFECAAPPALAQLPKKWLSAELIYAPATLNYTTRGNRLGSRAIYSCAVGGARAMRGTRAYAVCTPSGEWMPAPELACLEVGCFAEYVPNGKYINACTRVGAIGEVRCHDGFRLVGPLKTCVDFTSGGGNDVIARWSSDASLECVREDACALVNCGEGGTCIALANAEDGYKCDCAPGYELDLNSTTGANLHCKRADPCRVGWNLCANARCIITANSDGKNWPAYRCECEEGMLSFCGANGNLIVPNRSHLRDNATCIRMRCPSPDWLLPTAAHTIIGISALNESLFLAGTVLHIVCVNSTLHFELKCLAAGRWNRDKRIECISAKCPIPHITHRIRILDPRREYYPYDVARFDCASPTDVMFGPNVIFCNASAKWNSAPPICKPSNCTEWTADLSKLSAFVRFVNTSAPFGEGAVAELFCRLKNSSVALSGRFLCAMDNKSSSGAVNLRWFGTYRECHDLDISEGDCTLADTPSNILLVSGITGTPLNTAHDRVLIGDIAHTECVQPNYSLTGEAKLMCATDRTLSPVTTISRLSGLRVRRDVPPSLPPPDQKLCVRNKHSFSAVYVGESINLLCHIVPGCDHYLTRWIKATSGHELLAHTKRYDFTLIGYIESAQLSDAGEYLCEVVDEGGDVVDVASWTLKVSGARIGKSWRETLAAARPTIVRAFDSSKQLNGWNASSHWTHLADGSWRYTPSPFGFKDYLITPMVDVKSTWLGISVDLAECRSKCLVWLSYFSADQQLGGGSAGGAFDGSGGVSAEKFNTLGGATLDPDSHSIHFVLPYSKVWILITVDPQSAGTPLRLNSLHVTITACPEVRLGLTVFPETIVSPTNRSIAGICAVTNARPIENYTRLACGPQGVWSVLDESAEPDVLQVSNCICEDSYVERFGACVERGPLCYSCTSTATSSCILERDAHFCERGEVCRSRTIRPNLTNHHNFNEEGFIEKGCAPISSCVTTASNVERCMAGVEECTLCCSHDGCNWRPEKAAIEKTTTTTTTTATTTTTMTTTPKANTLTTSTTKMTTNPSTVNNLLNKTANWPICIDRQPLQLFCQPTFRVDMLAPNFYAPTALPFPRIIDNEPHITLSASLDVPPAGQPYAFNGSERVITWTARDVHGVSATCQTHVDFVGSIEHIDASNNDGATEEDDLLDCPERAFVDEHWDSTSVNVVMRLPTIKLLQHSDGSKVLLGRLNTDPRNGSIVRLDQPTLVTVSAFINHFGGSGSNTRRARCQFWYLATERGCPMWAVDERRFICTASPKMSICYRRQPCARSQRDFPDDVKTLLCQPGHGGWRLVNDTLRAIPLDEIAPMRQLPICLNETAANVTLMVDLTLKEDDNNRACSSRLTSTLRFELAHFLDLRCPIIGWRFAAETLTAPRLHFNFTTAYSDADQVAVCVGHIADTIASNLPSFSSECRQAIQVHAIRPVARCVGLASGWGISADNLRCIHCAPGQFASGNGSCTPCARGTFSTSVGAISCIPCPANTSTIEEGAASVSECISLCPPGQFSMATNGGGTAPCVRCPMGTYQPDVGQSLCITCPAHMTTRSRAATSRAECISNCAPGNFFHRTSVGTECVPCPHGFYQPDYGQSGCLRCPVGTTTAIAGGGANSAQFCKRRNCWEDGCSRHGACDSTSNACICAPGFTGVDCSVAFDLCTASYCLNGGICHYRGPSVGSKCTCPQGAQGERCERIDSTLFQCTAQTIVTSAFCRLQRRLSATIADARPTPMLVLDQVSPPSKCAPNQLNVLTNARCEHEYIVCAVGLRYLNSIRACVPENGACTFSPCGQAQCEDHAEREKQAENYQCVCMEGFGGQFCEHVLHGNECSLLNPCLNGGRCVDAPLTSPSQRMCLCPSEWTGTLCETRQPVKDPCATQPCGAHGVCRRFGADFYCDCELHYFGEFCTTPRDICALRSRDPSLKCKNGGVCDATTAPMGNCRCGPNFHGSRCEHIIKENLAEKNHCQNNGTRQKTAEGNVYCACPFPYIGERCEFKMDPCNKDPFGDPGLCGGENHGRCETNGNTYDAPFTCKCIAGWNESIACMAPKNLSCDENLACHESDNIAALDYDGDQLRKDVLSLAYICQPGKYGDRCQYSIDYCRFSGVCMNGGACQTTDNAFNCSCLPQFTGLNCEIATTRDDTINDCFGHPQNINVSTQNLMDYSDACSSSRYSCGDGICRVDDDTHRPYCSCPPQLTGTHCEKEMYIDSFNIYFVGKDALSHRIHSAQLPSNVLKDGISVCGFVKIDSSDTLSNVTPLNASIFASFGTINLDNKLDREFIRFTTAGILIMSNKSEKFYIPPNDWKFICVLLHITNSNGEPHLNYRIYFDGHFITRAFNVLVNARDLTVPQLALFLGNDEFIQHPDKAPHRTRFTGEITRFEIFDEILDEKTLTMLANSCAAPDDNMPTLKNRRRLIKWFIGGVTDFNIVDDPRNSQIFIIRPGICINAEEQRGAPYTRSCPSSQRLLLDRKSRLAIAHWEERVEKMFGHSNNGIIISVRSNYRAGQAFGVGKHHVIYTASDMHGGSATCEFDIVVARHDCAPPSYSKELVNLELKRPSTDIEDARQVANVQCKSQSFIFSNPKSTFYTCDIMGNWDAFLPPGAHFNLPTCVRTTAVMQRVEGSVLFSNASCKNVGNYLALVLERIIRASAVSNEAFCKMPNCEGQLSLRSVCQDGMHKTVRKRRELKKTRRAPQSATSHTSGVLIQYILRVNNTKHVVEPAIRTKVSADFGAENYFNGAVKLGCTQPDFSLLHIKAVNKTNGDATQTQFAHSGRTTLTIRKNVPNKTANMTQEEQERFVLQCSTCGPGETWLPATHLASDIPFAHIYDVGELVIWAALNFADSSSNFLEIGVRDNILLGARSGVCIRCPPDMFKERPGVEPCTPCPAGETTGELQGAISRADCFLNCSMGSVFDFEMNKCVKCPKGQYMPHSGRLRCLPCPDEFTTERSGSTRIEDCSKACGSGEELTANEECTKCAIGTFRTARNVSITNRHIESNGYVAHCVRCPLGFNTSAEGAKSIDACNQIYCPPGFRQRCSQNSTVTHSKNISQFVLTDVCDSCERGYFQDEYNAKSCKPCPHGWSTDKIAAISAKACVVPTLLACQPNIPTTCSPTLECRLAPISLTFGQREITYACQLPYGELPLPIDSSRTLEYWLLFAFGAFSFIFTLLVIYSVKVFWKQWVLLFYRHCPTWMMCCKKMTVNDISGNDYIRDASHAPTTREPATTIIIDSDFDGQLNDSQSEVDSVSSISGINSEGFEFEAKKSSKHGSTKRKWSDSNLTRWSASESELETAIGGSSTSENRRFSAIQDDNAAIEDPLDEIRSSFIECLVSDDDEMEFPIPGERDASITPRQSHQSLRRSASTPSVLSRKSETKPKDTSQKRTPANLTVQTTMNQPDNGNDFLGTYGLHQQRQRQTTSVDTTPMLFNKTGSDYSRATNAIGRLMFSNNDDCLDETHKSIFRNSALSSSNRPAIIGSKFRNTRLPYREERVGGGENIDRPNFSSEILRPHTSSAITNKSNVPVFEKSYEGRSSRRPVVAQKNDGAESESSDKQSEECRSYSQKASSISRNQSYTSHLSSYRKDHTTRRTRDVSYDDDDDAFFS